MIEGRYQRAAPGRKKIEMRCGRGGGPGVSPPEIFSNCGLLYMNFSAVWIPKVKNIFSKCWWKNVGESLVYPWPLRPISGSRAPHEPQYPSPLRPIRGSRGPHEPQVSEHERLHRLLHYFLIIYYSNVPKLMSTAIPRWKHRFSSDHRS